MGPSEGAYPSRGPPYCATLSAMESLRGRYDRICAQLTIETGFMHLAGSATWLGIAVLNIRDYFRTHDAIDKYVGVLASLMCVMVLFHAIQIFRAIARRRREECPSS